MTSAADFGEGQAERLAPRGTAPQIRQLAALLADGLAEFANATLALDPLSAARLAALEGSCLLIRSSGSRGAARADGTAFTLQVTGGQLRLLKAADATPNTIVSGTLPDLIGWALSRGRNSPAGLRVDGDTRLLETLAEVGDSYRPDLERPLGRLVGPANASRVLAAAEVAFAGMRSLLQSATTGVRQGAAQWFATDRRSRASSTNSTTCGSPSIGSRLSSRAPSGRPAGSRLREGSPAPGEGYLDRQSLPAGHAAA